MEPIGPTIGILMAILARTKVISFPEAQILQELIMAIAGLFLHAKRRCTDAKFECKYKEGSCFVLITKGADWTLKDVETCQFRQKMEDK